MHEFSQKTAVITGAASGIGRALALKCASLDMKLVLVDVEEAPLQQLAEHLKNQGKEVLASKTDISQAQAVEALAKTAFGRFGAVHLLFNNAGVYAGERSWETSLPDWQWMMEVNLWGLIHGIRTFVPRMLAQSGAAHIVNTGSIAGLTSPHPSAAYAVVKHGVVALSEQLHYELLMQRAPIRVSVLCPGWVQTRILDSERNRPQNLTPPDFEEQSSAKLDEDRAAFHKGMEQGQSPEEIAEKVFDAIRSEQFYILTHPALKDSIQVRMENILGEKNPDLSHLQFQNTGHSSQD